MRLRVALLAVSACAVLGLAVATATATAAAGTSSTKMLPPVRVHWELGRGWLAGRRVTVLRSVAVRTIRHARVEIACGPTSRCVVLPGGQLRGSYGRGRAAWSHLQLVINRNNIVLRITRRGYVGRYVLLRATRRARLRAVRGCLTPSGRSRSCAPGSAPSAPVKPLPSTKPIASTPIDPDPSRPEATTQPAVVDGPPSPTDSPPKSTALPALSGKATDGEVLGGSTGTWTGTPTITYTRQWRRCDAGGAGCTDIAGASGATYTLTSDDVGKTVREVVTAKNAGGTATATSKQSDKVAPAPPLNTVLPAIAGTPSVGQLLTANDGTWTGTIPQTSSYAWQRCNSVGAHCTDISGARAATYTPVDSDAGLMLRVRVRHANDAGSVAATSGPSAKIAAAPPTPPVNVAAPTIGGTATQGEMLSVTSDGLWSGTVPQSTAYQWQSCDAGTTSCGNIGGARSSSYRLTASEVGRTVRVVVTRTNSVGPGSAASATTATVTPPQPTPPVNVSPPSIAGAAIEGATLAVASEGTWSGTTPQSTAYQWQSCEAGTTSCGNIGGATSSTYTLTAGEVGRTVRVVVTRTNDAGPGSAASATTGTIAPIPPTPPVNLDPPTVSGSAIVGGTLSSSLGSWTGTEPIDYARQWQRCNAGGQSCEDVVGATGETYALTADDVDATLRVVVTASNAATSTSARSAPSDVVAAA